MRSALSFIVSPPWYKTVARTVARTVAKALAPWHFGVANDSEDAEPTREDAEPTREDAEPTKALTAC